MTDFDAAKTTYTCPKCRARVGPDDLHRARDGRSTIVGCTKCPNRLVEVDEDGWK